MGQEKYEEGIKLYEQVLEINPENPNIQFNLIIAQARMVFEPFSGVAEIIIRDSDGRLVGYMQTEKITLNNVTLAQEAVDKFPKKIITHGDQKSEVITIKNLRYVDTELVAGKTFVYGRSDTTPFITTSHWGYPITYGDQIYTNYIIETPIE